MYTRRLVIALSLVTFLAACGSDAPSQSLDASPISSESNPSLLVSELPEFSGPTVLWFWAPG